MKAFSVPCTDAYTAPWWLPGRHWQTLYGIIVQWFRFLPEVAYRQPNEKWQTPQKDDFIELAWIESTRDRTDQDLYVVFHGLEGDKDSAYARVLMVKVAERGDCGVIVHFRSCGDEPNLLARSYHAGDSDEIDWILRRFRSENPNSRIFATGYSLGGAALLKWLGEPARKSHEVIDRAAAVSAPVDLAATANAVSRGFSLVYSWGFLRSLKPKCFEKLRRFPDSFDGEALRRARTLYEFEAIVTAPVHGFRDVDDYHTRGSAKSGLRNITVPTLIVTAENDPIVPLQSMENLQVSKPVVLDRPKEGGHAGFFCGRWPGVSNWISDRLLRHFSGN